MSAIKVIKRDGTIVDYDRSKIKLAIQKANEKLRWLAECKFAR